MQKNNLFTKKQNKTEGKNNLKELFAIYKCKVYIINSAKLDTILSLMKLLYEFLDYADRREGNNITDWLKNKNLLEEELLEEISYKILE